MICWIVRIIWGTKSVALGSNSGRRHLQQHAIRSVLRGRGPAAAAAAEPSGTYRRSSMSLWNSSINRLLRASGSSPDSAARLSHQDRTSKGQKRREAGQLDLALAYLMILSSMSVKLRQYATS